MNLTVYGINPGQKRISIILIAFVIHMILNGLLYAEAEIGSVVMIMGKAYITRGETELPAEQGDPVWEHDTVRTEGTSKIKIYLKDDSVITLGENTKLSVEEYMFALEEGRRSVVLNLIGGRLRVIVGQILEAVGSKYEVKSPTSVIGVRGTHFYLYVISGITKIAVFSGEVDASNVLEVVKGIVRIKAGQMSIVPENEPPGEPVRISSEEQIKLMLETEIYDEDSLIEKETLPLIKIETEEKNELSDAMKSGLEPATTSDFLPPLNQEPIQALSEVTVRINLPVQP
ncbi:MAG TPA: FecR family protein [bacterium]